MRVLLNGYEETEKTERERPREILFAEYLKQWHCNCVSGFLEDTTSDGYKHNLTRHIIPYFENMNIYLHELERSHIQGFVKYMHENGRLNGKGGMKTVSIKKFVANISRALDQAVIDKFIPENPCVLIRYPKESSHEAKFLKQPELEKLLLASEGTVIEAAIHLAVYYALRRGEILGIRWQDIDFEDNIVHIRNTRVRISREVEKNPKNKASRAPMPLMLCMREFLLKLKKQQEEQAQLLGKQYHRNDYICKWEDGRPFEYKYINTVLMRILKKSGLPQITLHELRHSTATLLRTQGFSIQEIQSWLRHADIKSTMRYAHDDIEIRMSASSSLNGLFGEKQRASP